jgi:CheY-like chemotaxis protein
VHVPDDASVVRWRARFSVLIVDDDEDVRASLSEALEARHIGVATAANGEAALAHLLNSRTPPDLILLDLLMPRKSGYELLHALRNTVTLMSVPVVVLSAYLKSPPAGAVAWLRKPIKPADLVRAIERYAPA